MLEILVGPGAELRKKIIAKGIISRRIHLRKLPKTRRFVGLACRGRVRAWCGWCVGFLRSWAERVMMAIPTYEAGRGPRESRSTQQRSARACARRARAHTGPLPARAVRDGAVSLSNIKPFCTVHFQIKVAEKRVSVESAFVRNSDTRHSVNHVGTFKSLSLSQADTYAGELRWCKHEEGLMILIPHMDGSPHSVADISKSRD